MADNETTEGATTEQVEAPEVDTQTWISFTDANGKAQRVKSEDYKDGA
jgi:hypothetical protein